MACEDSRDSQELQTIRVGHAGIIDFEISKFRSSWNFHAKHRGGMGPGLLEFETRLTHIFTRSAISIMRNTREPFGRNGKREEEEGKKKEPWRIPKELSPRNFHIGNSYFNGGWIFHRETGKGEEEFRTRTRQSNFVRLVNSSKWPDKPTKLERVFISRIFENLYTMRWNNWK